MIATIKKRIGLKLALLFFGVLCVAMGGLVAFNALYYADFGTQVIAENERRIRQQSMAYLQELTRQRAQRYQAVFDKLAGSSRLIARQTELRFALANDPPKRLVKADEYLNTRLANGLLYNPLADPVAVVYWGGKSIPAAVDKELNTLLPLFPVFADAMEGNAQAVASFLIMSSGTGYYYPNSEMLYSLPPVTQLDLRDTNNYVLAHPQRNPERRTVWTPVYFDDVGNGLITSVVTPIFGRHGEFLGASGLDVPLARIHHQILQEQLPQHDLRREGLFSFLLDERGKILAFPMERLAEFGIESQHEEFKDSFDLLDKGLADSALAEVQTLGKRVAATPGATEEFTLRGDAYVVSWQQLPATNWRLVSIVPQRVFLAPLQEVHNLLQLRLGALQRESYLLAVLFFGAAMALTLTLLRRYFIRPLQQLTLVAERVRDGDLTPELPGERADEIGSLTVSFGRMIAALRQARNLEKDYAQNLERQVAEQTRQVQAQKVALEQTLDLLQKDILRRQQVELELTNAKQAAEAANQAKSQFLANITHELRTPLIGVLGMNELLAGSPLTPAQQVMVKSAQRSGEALLELINDVLDFSRLESDVFALTERAIEIGGIVEQATALLAERAAAKDVHLACRIEPAALWVVKVDPVRLRQILVNLIGNAVKFTPQGEVTVTLAMAGQDEGHGRFVIEVRDTGIGMSEQVLARIFAPFVQGDASPTREFGGSGLGLAIVKQLVALMGGKLSLQSKVGKGSVFSVELELPLVAQSALPGSTALRGKRLLLQAAHPFARETLQQMLSTLGGAVVEALTGEAAWREYQAAAREGHPFAVVLVEAAARLADGSRLLQRLHDEVGDGSLLIIALSPPGGRLSQDIPDDWLLLEEPVGWPALVETFKASGPDTAPSPSALTADPLAAALAGAGPTRKLLIVDDYPVTRELVCRFLDGYPVALDQAASGAEVMAIQENHEYDLILMDVSMPELDGMEVTRRLRAKGYRGPIVALTAHIDSQVIKACQTAGMDDYLPKPFRRRELLETVAKWLAREDCRDMQAG